MNLSVSPYLLLLSLFEKHTENIIRISAENINHINAQLTERYFDCDFSHMAFKQIALEYAEYVHIEYNELCFDNDIQFRELINQRTRYIRDQDIIDTILELL